MFFQVILDVANIFKMVWRDEKITAVMKSVVNSNGLWLKRVPPIQGMWNTALFCQSIFLKVYDWSLVRKYTIICSALLVWKVTCNKDVLQVAVQPPYKGLYFQLTGKGLESVIKISIFVKIFDISELQYKYYLLLGRGKANPDK